MPQDFIKPKESKSKVPIILPEKANDSFVAYFKSCARSQSEFLSNQRAAMEATDRAYQREVSAHDRESELAERAHKSGDTSRFRNVTIPIVMPQVEAAVVYQTSVFLTGHPLFAVVAAPADMNAALQLETKIEADSEKGGWTRELMMFFRDGFKHNLAAIEVSWKREVVPAIETDLQDNIKVGKVVDVAWEGNTVRRIDPYNLIFDRSCAPAEVHKKGEFVGYSEVMSRIALKDYISSIPDNFRVNNNLKAAFESSAQLSTTDHASSLVFVPTVNPKVNPTDYTRGQTNWMDWAGLMDESKKKIAYKDNYVVTTLYCRILPSEFNLIAPKANTPQIYKLVLVNGEHIIEIEKMTNAHKYFPILIAQPNEDGLGEQTKSLAKNAEPFQEVTTAYMTSILASRRRSISDRALYNPALIDSAQINNPNPSAKIPVRPNAYNAKLSDAVYQFPYREDQAGTSMQQISALVGIANTLNGQNQARQGQFVKGNKTLKEYEDVMSNSDGRDRLTSILLEHQVFTPMKYMLKTNILQYEGGSTLYNKEREVMVHIDPIKLREAVLSFKLSDGLTPSEKLAGTESLQVALQVLGSSPQLAGEYNLGPLFSYIMKLQGAKITEFEKSQPQIAYEQAVSVWQQTALEVIKAGGDTKSLGAMPKPQDYGYNPEAKDPTNQVQSQGQQNG